VVAYAPHKEIHSLIGAHNFHTFGTGQVAESNLLKIEIASCLAVTVLNVKGKKKEF
jgi:tRNA U38,U39,U40 pseudouridine synthase TruA